jgi:hypothetical protein
MGGGLLGIEIRRINTVRPDHLSPRAWRRTLLRLDAKHDGAILVRSVDGPQGKLWVNVAALRAALGAFAAREYATRDELEDLREDVEKVNVRLHAQNQRQNALARAQRQLRFDFTNRTEPTETGHSSA